jgi:ribosome-binding factor A
MPFDKRTREQLLAHCGELHEDDGVDPRLFFQSDRKRNKQDHKTRQLCDQVAQTLGLVLAGEFNDERLHNLEVVSVEPAPNASQLAVSVRIVGPCDMAEVTETLEQLALVSGRLRCEVAAAISRKRAPRLAFRLVGPFDNGEVRP